MRNPVPARALACLPLLALLALGCARTPEPPRTAPIPGYLQLQETFGPRDFGPLTGRRLLIDPGHGGYYRGALGPDGLAEADVNLGVALHLRGLLEWAGADVYLTRTADYDFLAGSDSTLAADLGFRVSLIDSLQPDVFLSIHHNSTASRDETINETQTYYPLNDEAASLDLARAVHRHLVRNLEIEPARILPGNFHVLRHASVPAVLGEPAMISNPVMEERLSLAASHRLEAEAYFLGLLDYFAAGTPAWSGAPIDTLDVDPRQAMSAVTWTFLPAGTAESEGPRAPGPDPSTFRLLRNGVAEAFHVSADGAALTWLPTGPPPPESILLEVSGRNLAGRATPLRRTLVRTGADDHLRVRLLVPGIGATDTVLIHWRSIGDAPAPAGTLDLPGIGPRAIVGGREGWLPAVRNPGNDGKAGFLPVGAAIPIPVPVRIDTLPAGFDWRLLEIDGRGVGSKRLESRRWLSRLTAGFPVVGLQAFDSAGAALPLPSEQAVWIETPGLLPIFAAAAGAPDSTGTVRRADRLWATPPVLPELFDVVIVLDPAAADSGDQGTGPTGLRGADVNLAVARFAASLLEGAGARVHLTRTDGAARSNPDKIRLAEQVDADLFLTIGRTAAADTVRATHHPGSAAGERWARAFAKSWRSLADLPETTLVKPSWAYLLRHTACPALEIALPGPGSLESESRLDDPGWQRAEARAVFLSIAAARGGDALLDRCVDPLDLVRQLDGSLETAEVDWIRWDGNFLWTPCAPCTDPPASERATARSAESLYSSAETGNGPGLPAVGDRHTLELHAGSRWQLWLLERGDTGWTSHLLSQGG